MHLLPDSLKEPKISKHSFVRNYLHQPSFLTGGQNWKVSFLLYHPIQCGSKPGDIPFLQNETKEEIQKSSHMHISYQ